MYVIPPQFRNGRVPGQVPNAEGMRAVRAAETPAPSAKLTAKRLLEDHGSEPRPSPQSVVKGLGLDAAQEQSWVKFLKDSVNGVDNEVTVRKALYEKIASERQDPVLRNVLFQRSMSYYRTRMQKSGSLSIAGQQCVVVTVDELRKAKLGEALSEKPKADPEARRKMQLQRKADREHARKLKEETQKGPSAFDEPGSEDLADDDALKSKDTSAPAPIEPPEHSAIGSKPPTAPAARTPMMQAPGRANSLSRTKIQTHVSYRAKQGAPIAGLNKSAAPTFYLTRQKADLEKADPKGGLYHKRITDNKSGKHKYFYDPAKYASHPDAHVDGAEAAKSYIHKQITKKLDEHGECAIEDFKDLAMKHGPDKIGDALREGCENKQYEFRKGKFRKCMGGTNAVG